MAVTISADQEALRMDDIQPMLSKVFWSPNITKQEILKGIENSALVVGAYTETGQQVGFLRVVSDKVRFAYLLVQFALSHSELKDVYQWLLLTLDAHGVYQKCGFAPLKNPENWMAIIQPRPDRAEFEG
jgi:hypothetical protein